MQVCVFLCTTCQTRSRLLSALQLIRQRTVSALSITQSLFVLCSSKLLSLIFFFIFIETEEDSNYRYIRYSKYKLQTLKIVEFLRCENNKVQTKQKMLRIGAQSLLRHRSVSVTNDIKRWRTNRKISLSRHFLCVYAIETKIFIEPEILVFILVCVCIINVLHLSHRQQQHAQAHCTCVVIKWPRAPLIQCYCVCQRK